MSTRPTKRWLGAAVLLALVAGAVVFLLPDAEPEPREDEGPRTATPLFAEADEGAPDEDPYVARFLEAQRLVDSDDPRIDAALDDLLERAAPSSPERMAAEFVRWSRSGAPPPRRRRPRGARPNVLLVSIDTLRADHLGCYGHDRDVSPNIDDLAARGAVFLQAFSTASWTLPGHMSMLTSLYPSFHKLEARRGIRLDSSETTLAELLKAAGYRTAGFVNHPFLSARWGFDEGFDIYFRQPRIVRAEAQARMAIRWLEWHAFHERLGAGPAELFMFLHFMDPHETYDPPPEFREKYAGGYEGELKPEDHFVTMFLDADFESDEDYRYVLGLYDGEIAYVDQQLGRVFDVLQAWELLDSTLVIVTSDHGEEFKEHGSMGHKTTLYVEQLRVPLIVVHPVSIAADQQIEEQASLVDLYPTIARAAGVEVPPRAQGIDLSALLSEPGHAVSESERSARGRAGRPIFAGLGPTDGPWEGPPPMRSIRTERYRLIWGPDDDAKELYDITVDPMEQRDLYGIERGRREVRRLERRLKAFVAEGASYKPGVADKNKIVIDPKTQEQLRALGYAD